MNHIPSFVIIFLSLAYSVNAQERGPLLRKLTEKKSGSLRRTGTHHPTFRRQQLTASRVSEPVLITDTTDNTWDPAEFTQTEKPSRRWSQKEFVRKNNPWIYPILKRFISNSNNLTIGQHREEEVVLNEEYV